jgi:hypothetical protein
MALRVCFSVFFVMMPEVWGSKENKNTAKIPISQERIGASDVCGADTCILGERRTGNGPLLPHAGGTLSVSDNNSQ